MGSWFSSPALNGRQIEEVLLRLEATRIERELAIQEALRRRELALEMAREREELVWWGAGGGVTALFSALSSFHHRNLLHVLPLVPISSIIAYKAHLAYGNKRQQIEEVAEELLEFNEDAVVVSQPSVEEIKKRMDELSNRAKDF